MTEQAAPGTMANAAGDTGAHGLDAQIGLSHEHEEYHGRPASWVAVSVIIVGFIVGGIALVITGQVWWLFWTGTGIVVIGCIMAAAAHILDDWY